MVISKNKELRADIEADEEILEQVEHFKYLGQIVNNEIKSDQEIIKRIAQAKSTFINMSDILLSKDISLKLRLKIINLYIYPIVLYGDETWTLYTDTINRIEAFEMWIFRKLARVSYKDRITNVEVLRRLGVKRELMSKIKKDKLTYFGHVMRHESIQKTILTGKTEGQRGRGRPRRKWTDDIKDWTGMNMTNCSTLAQNRASWRTVASQPLSSADRVSQSTGRTPRLD